ncbi:MAG: NTP transferase domain-containing protein [bacterium]|nr:NTP transferase domain-containing protein [bacterium]
MKAIILAGGNQTRFGKTVLEQSKVLYPLPDGKTILSNILDQLDRVNLEEIIVSICDKDVIATYVEGLKMNYKTPISLDKRLLPGLGNYFFNSTQHLPATYIFGDIYFPDKTITEYFANINQYAKFTGMIGVNRNPVGDYIVEINGDLVTAIKKGMEGDYYTCGVFTIFDPKITEKLTFSDKMTDIFAELPRNGYKLGYKELKGKLIDIDTPDKISELKSLFK